MLSCAARKYEMYVVVNIPEKKASAESSIYYNCDVVFDREGRIVARLVQRQLQS